MEPNGRTRWIDVARGRCASIGWIVPAARLFDGQSDCACYASERATWLLIFISDELGLIVRSARSVATVAIGGVLNRETINGNRTAFLDSPLGPRRGAVPRARGGSWDAGRCCWVRNPGKSRFSPVDLDSNCPAEFPILV